MPFVSEQCNIFFFSLICISRHRMMQRRNKTSSTTAPSPNHAANRNSNKKMEVNLNRVRRNIDYMEDQYEGVFRRVNRLIADDDVLAAFSN